MENKSEEIVVNAAEQKLVYQLFENDLCNMEVVELTGLSYTQIAYYRICYEKRLANER